MLYTIVRAVVKRADAASEADGVIHTTAGTRNHHIPLHPTPADQGLLVLVPCSSRAARAADRCMCRVMHTFMHSK